MTSQPPYVYVNPDPTEGTVLLREYVLRDRMVQGTQDLFTKITFWENRPAQGLLYATKLGKSFSCSLQSDRTWLWWSAHLCNPWEKLKHGTCVKPLCSVGQTGHKDMQYVMLTSTIGTLLKVLQLLQWHTTQCHSGMGRNNRGEMACITLCGKAPLEIIYKGWIKC